MLAFALLALAVISTVAGVLALRLRRETDGRRRSEVREDVYAEVIEALPGGFVVWDADDKLVLHDEEFLRVYARNAPLLYAGARYEDCIRAGALAGQFPAEEIDDDIEAFVVRTAHAHQSGNMSVERRMPDGSWILVNERPLAGGGILGVCTDITELKRIEAALKEATARANHLAHHDPLTGLPNRTVFDTTLRKRCASPEPVALICLDLDGFKAVNYTLGHTAGDEFLKSAAGRIRHVAGEDALVARIGSDEFAVLLPDGTSEEHGCLIADVLVRILAQPFSAAGRRVTTVGASVGLAFEAGFMAHDLARTAADACHAARRAGGNSWRQARSPFPSLLAA